MSGNPEEEKEAQKALPLDLARTQITTVRTVESTKAPLVMTSQALRSVRVLAQGVSSSSNPSSVGQAIITNLVPQAVIKQDANRAQITSIVGNTQSHTQPHVSGGLTLPRPAQITLSATPLVAQNSSGTSYHVPRGPAVVANLAAPRSNVTTVRTPLVVTAQNSQTHTFVRPPRTPSPAQGTAWLTTNSSNGSQIKGAPTVLSSPVRGATVTGKPQTTARTPQTTQAMSTVRPGTLLSNAITIGQTIHSFKSTSGGMQALGNTVTLTQMLPARTQGVVYTANTAAQFTPAARITVATTAPNQIRPTQPRVMGSGTSGPRLAVPISQAVQNSRIMTPTQSTTLVSNTRISPGTSVTHPQPVLATSTRIVTAQPTANVVGRLSVTPSTVSGTVSNPSNILPSQARISTLSTLNLQSLMAVANGGPARIQTTQGPKVITQPAQATIHLAQIPSQIKNSTTNMVTTASRTINVPASIVTQRPNSVGPPQAISIAKVFPTNENQGTPGSANVFIHAPLQASVQRHPSPSPGTASSVPQQIVPSGPPTAPSYSLANQEASSYFYDNNSAQAGGYQRAFVNQQSNTFVAQPQGQQPQISRPPATVSNQSLHNMRFGSLMVVEQGRSQQQTTQYQPIAAQSSSEHQTSMDTSQHQSLPPTQTKITSSPRPSILRKRDHEGSPLKAAKNLTPVLQTLNIQTPPHPPSSPPSSPRPDSRGNGHSSGGSTTISATSSPGLAEVNDDSNPPVPMNIKEEEEEENKPAMEMSPRKKPRKQQLTGNEIEENHDDMQFISESRVVKKENYDSDGQNSDLASKDGAPEAPRITTLRKPATASLLNGYRQTWKATHNHYQRYSDVKPKDERRPTIIDLANQNRVLEKVNGWKVHHLSTQMEDLAEQEESVHAQLTDLLKFTESEESSKQSDKEVNRVNELIKGNLQRIKIIHDGMVDAKCQIMKVFDHQRHVNDILSRCVSKRNFKKREKS